jgi:hypothetical protein
MAISEEKIFLEINQSETRMACLLTDRDEMSILYRGSSIDASYQVSVHLAKQFQKRRFLEINQPETRIAYGSHVCQQIGMKLAVPPTMQSKIPKSRDVTLLYRQTL